MISISAMTLGNERDTAFGSYLPTLVLLATLPYVTWLQRDHMNVDGVSYIRIAQYYLSGNTDLAISGYWGPMLSWLIAPWLVVIEDPVFAAHAAMATSALVFIAGGISIFRAFELPSPAMALATWVLTLLAVTWSTTFVTPDLLMGGILSFGTSLLVSNKWVSSPRAAFCTGLVLGAAYLAKAVALPASILFLAGFAGVNLFEGRAGVRQTIKSAALVLLGLFLIASPWIGILSHKYGGPTFSTTGAIAHAIVGPGIIVPEHTSFSQFHRPEAGRISSWEDPSVMPYPYWSPIESAGNAVHQFSLAVRSTANIIAGIKNLDLIGLGFASVILSFILGFSARSVFAAAKWRWAVIPVAALSAIYVPVFSDAVRYIWPCFPLVLGASYGTVLALTGHYSHCKQHATLALAVLTLSFVFGNLGIVIGAFAADTESTYLTAKNFARKLATAGQVGPIASVEDDKATGYYMAFLLNTPWHGQMYVPESPDQVHSSGAKLIAVTRGHPMAERLRADSRFASTDRELFGCDGGAAQQAIEVFAVEPKSGRGPC